MRFPRQAIAMAILVLSAAVAGCDDSPVEPTSTSPVQYSIINLRSGTGAEAATGSPATISYTMWLYSATAFENKGQRIDGGTLTFTVGGNVIQGLGVGVRGMKVGGMRRLIVPPSLAFGEQGAGAVPPNAAVVFDVELLSAG